MKFCDSPVAPENAAQPCCLQQPQDAARQDVCALAPVSVSEWTRCLDEVAVAAAGEDEKLGAGHSS